jgi:hypothetical protein
MRCRLDTTMHHRRVMASFGIAALVIGIGGAKDIDWSGRRGTSTDGLRLQRQRKTGFKS